MITSIPVTQIIQTMTVPVVLISACALLLLGMNNKYSMVISRIRALEQERRSLRSALPPDALREKNVLMQLKGLAKRVRLDRNAVVSYSAAAGFFVLNSLLLGLQAVAPRELFLNDLSLIVFLAGMVTLWSGVAFACREAWLGYEIVTIELDEAGEIV